MVGRRMEHYGAFRAEADAHRQGIEIRKRPVQTGTLALINRMSRYRHRRPGLHGTLGQPGVPGNCGSRLRRGQVSDCGFRTHVRSIRRAAFSGTCCASFRARWCQRSFV